MAEWQPPSRFAKGARVQWTRDFVSSNAIVIATSYYGESEFTTIKIERSSMQITIPADALKSFQGYPVGAKVHWSSSEGITKFGMVWSTVEVGSTHYSVVLEESSNTLIVCRSLELYNH